MDFPSLPKWWSDADINRRQSQCCVSLGDSRAPCPKGWGMEHRAWGEGGRRQERLAPGETVKGGAKPWAGKEGEAEAQGLKWVKWNEARCPNDFWTGVEKTGCHTHHQPHGNELEHRPVSLGYSLFQHIVRHWPAGGTELSHLPDEILALHWKATHDISKAKISRTLTVHRISKTLCPGCMLLPVICSTPSSHRLQPPKTLQRHHHMGQMHFRKQCLGSRVSLRKLSAKGLGVIYMCSVWFLLGCWLISLRFRACSSVLIFQAKARSPKSKSRATLLLMLV